MIEHESAERVTHTGPGHRFADPGWCEGCWWEEFGKYKDPNNRNDHAKNCPGCTITSRNIEESGYSFGGRP